MITVIRHALHPVNSMQYLCGTLVAYANLREQPQEPVDVGHQVNCPECRTVINFCRRCISVSGYVCVRAA